MCYEERYFAEWAERAARRRREELRQAPARAEEHKPAPSTPERRPATTVPEPERVPENA